MALFKEQLLEMVTTGLNDLQAAQESGKVPANPLHENHFFGAWVTTALKTKRFDSILVSILKGWQQQARTLGVAANLKQQFIDLKSTYQHIATFEHRINTDLLNLLCEKLAALTWQITTDVSVTKKLSVKSGGLSSLVIAAEQFENGYNEQGELKVKLSCYVRGDTSQFITVAASLGILLFKMTSYKSKVKFHGEYIIQVNNNLAELPEIPDV
ncbi:MAG: DUF2913 family protein [Psychrobium sp.]|nr:DUF2913 family protein [Psychrobium sp.]